MAKKRKRQKFSPCTDKKIGALLISYLKYKNPALVGFKLKSYFTHPVATAEQAKLFEEHRETCVRCDAAFVMMGFLLREGLKRTAESN